MRIGRTPVQFGEYWLVEAGDRRTEKTRAAFIDWFDREAKSLVKAQQLTPA